MAPAGINKPKQKQKHCCYCTISAFTLISISQKPILNTFSNLSASFFLWPSIYTALFLIVKDQLVAAILRTATVNSAVTCEGYIPSPIIKR